MKETDNISAPAAESSKELKILLEVLGSDFDYISNIDVDACEEQVFKINRWFTDQIPGWNELKTYQERMQTICDLFVHPDDREDFLRETEMTLLGSTLSERNPVKYVNFREVFGDEVIYYQGKYVYYEIEGKRKLVAGFKNVDANMRAKFTEQLVFQTLIKDFECVGLININGDKLSDKIVQYRDSKWISEAIPGWDQEGHFSARLDLLMNSIVYEADRADFYANTRREVIFSALSADEAYFVDFRIDVGSIPLYYQMKFTGIRDTEDHLVSMIVGIHNVDAETRRRQEQQRALEEALSMAQAANRAKTKFLNNMSHDIRTPMNAIIGFTGLAAAHIGNAQQVMEYLKKVTQASDHLLSLINDVLDMSRIESGKMTMNEKEEDLSEIMHTLRNIVQSDIAAKQLDFYIDTQDLVNERIVCDKLRLNQILLNVLSNSIKYTPAGGTVSIRIIQTFVRAEGYSGYQFRIKDTGMGMSPDFLEHIFEPFERVSNTTISGIQGTGLGMAITKNIVDMMGGKISIESEPGHGTEVIIDLDFKTGSERRTQNEPIVQLCGLPGLVVDDDINSCISISKMLRNIGMRSEWCTSGHEAVIRAEEAKSRQDSFEVFIIDWLMPDMNGIETVRRIRRVIGDETPIIIVTAYDWSDIEEEARAAGVTGFVNKPVFPTDLRETLLKHFSIEEKPAAEPVAESNEKFTGKKLLLVEDNELNREIACEILEEYGFSIDTAEDGTIAVQKMESAVPGQYDLILMDVQMPLMNGYEATRRIRALPDRIVSGIPIIAMTANAFEEDRMEAINAGMNDHLAKPINIDRLKEVLRIYL